MGERSKLARGSSRSGKKTQRCSKVIDKISERFKSAIAEMEKQNKEEKSLLNERIQVIKEETEDELEQLRAEFE